MQLVHMQHYDHIISKLLWLYFGKTFENILPKTPISPCKSFKISSISSYIFGSSVKSIFIAFVDTWYTSPEMLICEQ